MTAQQNKFYIFCSLYDLVKLQTARFVLNYESTFSKSSMHFLNGKPSALWKGEFAAHGVYGMFK